MFPARPHPFLLQSVARRGSTLRHALIAPFSSETVYHYRHSAAAPNLFSFSCLGLDLLAFSRFYLWTFSSRYILPCQFVLDKLFFRLSNTRNVDTLPLCCWISLETIVELKWWMVPQRLPKVFAHTFSSEWSGSLFITFCIHLVFTVSNFRSRTKVHTVVEMASNLTYMKYLCK